MSPKGKYKRVKKTRVAKNWTRVLNPMLSPEQASAALEVLPRIPNSTQNAARVINIAQEALERQYDSEIRFIVEHVQTSGARIDSEVVQGLLSICVALEEIEKHTIFGLDGEHPDSCVCDECHLSDP